MNTLVATALVLLSCAAPPNVVLLSVDTLRADRLGCYGYCLPTSPNIDGLAQHGLVFDDCICEIPLTAPSFTAMMTSRVPRTLGVVRNGLPLPDGVRTVAECFRDAGYQTFCVQSNWTLKARLSRLHRGFDIYDDAFYQRRWGVLKSEREADDVTERARTSLAKRDPNKPFFAWIHYSDPHAPYRFHRDYNPLGKSHELLPSEARTRAKYDSEVAFTDQGIGKLLAALPKDNTFVVFVADHGESLFEHGYLGHGRRLYQTSLHIPFIVHGPGIEPGRSNMPVRGLDVGPTLLGLAGLPPARDMLGLDVLRAVVPVSRVRVVETYGGAVPRLPGARALMAGRGPMRIGVVADGWKLILGGHVEELYREATDPQELHNMATREPERVAVLRALISAWSRECPRGVVAETPLNGDDVKALKSLGYLH